MRYGIRIFFYLLLASISAWLPGGAQSNVHQKVIILMMDGFGEDYYRNSDMPTLNKMEKQGLFKVVPSLMPSVTNVNNASIITGETPEMNGITGNVFLNPASGAEEYMEDSNLVLAPTIFERARKAGVKSILFSCKTKTVQLLCKGAGETMCWETASPEWVSRLGERPDIYSREVNYWIMEAALYSIKHDPDLGLIYIHTTDYPMHTWAPGSVESKEHLHKMDGYLAQLIRAAPDAAILVTADHNVNHKNRCWDLEKALATCGAQIKAAISPEKDRYFKHHLGMGGSAYIYLNDGKDSSRVRHLLEGFKGVEEVISKSEAVRRFHLMPERIGDLMVLADSTTVFGHLEKGESEDLPATYRSHGSLYEAHVPLFVYNARKAPSLSYFTDNYKLASWLYQPPAQKVKLVSVDPAVTGDGITTVHGPHIALYNPQKPDKHKLIFMITGTGTAAYGARQLDSCFAEMGYHVISIDYRNNINSICCKNSSDSTCFDRFREEIVTGHSVSEMTEVDSLNSIVHRFGQLLQYLAMNDPEGGWEEYLEGGRPAWRRIILAGHSQGSGNAGFLSKLVAVDRVLLFAGPQDYLAHFDHPAGWLSFKGKTPPSRYFSFLNLNDPFNVHNQLANDMKMMGMNKADTLHVWPRQTVQGHQHILVTDSPTTNGSGPHSSVLDPEYVRVWEYMLTARIAEE
jgi:phosphonoacetate hydrolase